MLLLGTNAAASAGPAADAIVFPFPVLLSCCSETEERHRLEQRKLTFFFDDFESEKQDRQFADCERDIQRKPCERFG